LIPSAGLGNFLVFLFVQAGAYDYFLSSLYWCCGREYVGGGGGGGGGARDKSRQGSKKKQMKSNRNRSNFASSEETSKQSSSRRGGGGSGGEGSAVVREQTKTQTQAESSAEGEEGEDDCDVEAGGEDTDSVYSRPSWTPDEMTTQCTNTSCKVSFDLFTRRHHCRHCGKIYCNKCSSKRCLLPPSSFSERGLQRVCDSCNEKLIPLQASIQQELEEALEQGGTTSSAIWMEDGGGEHDENESDSETERGTGVGVIAKLEAVVNDDLDEEQLVERIVYRRRQTLKFTASNVAAAADAAAATHPSSSSSSSSSSNSSGVEMATMSPVHASAML